jgi:hypothetical protein
MASKGSYGKQYPADACGGHLPSLPGPCQTFIKYPINEFGDDPRIFILNSPCMIPIFRENLCPT